MKRIATLINAFFLIVFGFVLSAPLKAQTYNLDAAVNSITLPDLLTPDNYAVTGTIRNNGTQTINTITLSWRVNGGPITQQTLSGMSLASGSSYNFTTTGTFTVNMPVFYNVEVTLSNPNGGTDQNNSNNTLNKQCSGMLKLPEKKVLLEEFTATWCGYCPGGALKAENIANTYPNDAIWLSVHGDNAMSISDYDAVREAFVTSYPSATVDRGLFSSTNSITTYITSYWLPQVTNRLDDLIPVAIEANTTFNITSRLLTINATAHFTAPLSGDYRLNCYVVEDHVTGGSSYNQSNYYSYQSSAAGGPSHPYYSYPHPIPGYDHRHVVRKATGGSWGTTGVISSSINADEEFSTTYTYTVPESYNAANMYVVVVVQKYNSADINDRQILNALRCNFNASAAHEIEILAEPPCVIPAAPVISASGTQLCPTGTGSPSSVTLNTASAAPTGFYYQWRRNGTNISGATGATYSATQAGTYTAYLVSATIPTCVSAFSNSIALTTLPVMATPAPSCTAQTPNSIVFGWNSISGAIGYVVSINGGSWQASNGLTSHTLTGLTPGTTATCTVIAIGGAYACQNSAASAAVICSTAPCAVVTPIISGLPITACTSDAAILLSGTPIGGIFTGTGIVGNNFYPNIAGAGTHTITYHYNASSICSYITTNAITVEATVSAPTFSSIVTGLQVNFISVPIATTYSWNYGDGSNGTGQNSTHIYSSEGIYNVCLTVTNTCNSNTTCNTISVNNNPCSTTTEAEWIQYTDTKQITALAEEGAYIWIGTTGGLVQLNKITGGKVFFNNANSGLPFNHISAIIIDVSGDKWIGTDGGGLVKFDGISWTTYNTSNSGLSNDFVTAIAIDAAGTKWIGNSNGLSKFDGTTWTVYNNSNSGLSDNYVYDIAIDNSGNKWIATGYGLSKLAGTTWTNYNPSNSGLTSPYLTSVAIDDANVKWIGMTPGEFGGGGLARFDGINWFVYDYPGSVSKVVIDSENNKWVGRPYFGGLLKFDGVDWTTFLCYSELPGCSVTSILIDANNNKWIGTTDGGLGSFNDIEWIDYNTSNSGLPFNSITALAVDAANNKWLGVSSYWGSTELTKFDGYEWSNFYDPAGGMIVDIDFDSVGNKWVSYLGGGIAKFDGTSWITYNTSNSGLPSNNVYAITIDAADNKWIGTHNSGLVKYDGFVWTVYNTSNSGLPNNLVKDIAIDPAGNKWIGTADGGLAKFDGINWETYNTANSGMPNDYVSAITLDAAGNKWIGTYGGLTKFDGTNWTTYNTSNSGLPSNNVYAITIDAAGNKWIGTYGGLIKFDGTNWFVYNMYNSGVIKNNVSSLVADNNGVIYVGADGGTSDYGLDDGGLAALFPPIPTCPCPTVSAPLSSTQAVCKGSAPDFGSAAAAIGYTDEYEQLDAIKWYSNAALTNEINPAVYTATHTLPNTCVPQTTTLYAALICKDITQAPIPAGSLTLQIYTAPQDIVPVGGCSLAAQNNCASGSVVIEYLHDGVWSNTPPAGSGAGGAVLNGDVGCYRAYVSGTPDNDGDGNPDCSTNNCMIATCPTCPIVTNTITASASLCEGATPNLSAANALLQYSDPYSKFGGIKWYSNPTLTLPLPADYTAQHTGNECMAQNVTLYAGMLCTDLGSVPIAAGTLTLQVYPTPSAVVVAPAGGCSLQVVPNCTGGGSLNIEYDWGFGTWDATPPSTPYNGQSMFWQAYVPGTPLVTGGTPACYAGGTVTASCTACPSVATIAPSNPLCYNTGSAFDLNTLKITTQPGVWSITQAPPGSNPATITSGRYFNASPNKDAGVYTVTFTLSGSVPAGCPVSSNQTITILPAISPLVQALGNTTFCQGGSVQLTLTGSYPAVLWSNGQSTNTIAATQSGTYTVTVTNSNFCTAVSNSIGVTVNPTPTAGFVPSATTISAGASVLFTNNSTGAVTYQWRINGAVVSSAEDLNYTFAASGTYLVELYAYSSAGCSGYAAQTITVNATVSDPLFTGTPTSGTAPLSVQFNHNSTGSTLFNWEFGDGSSSTLANPIHTYTASGVYTVSLSRLTGGIPVQETRTNYIIVQPNVAPVEAYFTAAPTTGAAPLTVSFINQSTGANAYSWAFYNSAGQLIGSSVSVNPQFTFASPGYYSICLTATGFSGTDQYCVSNYIQVNSEFSDGDLCIVAPSVISPGEQFTVEVWVNDLSTLVKAINPTLQYNTAYLNYAGYQIGTFFSSPVPGIILDNPSTGQIQMGVTSTTAANGTGLLFLLTFEVAPQPDEDQTVVFDFVATEAITAASQIIGLNSCSPAEGEIVVGDFCWPGDADNNGIVNSLDYILTGTCFNMQGPPRNVQGITWQPYQLGEEWLQSPIIFNGEEVSARYIDASGNGWIDNTDISATIINQGFVHARLSGEVVADGLTPGIAPDMPESANPGDMIQVPLWLGSAEEGVEDVQGFSFDLAIDSEKLDMSTLTIDYSGSPLGNIGADYFSNASIDAGNGIVSMVFTRNGLFPFSGYGIICTLRIQVKPEAPTDSYAAMTVGNVIAVDGSLNTFTLGSGEDQVHIVPEVIIGIVQPATNPEMELKVYPSPTDGTVYISAATSPRERGCRLWIYNTFGQPVYYTAYESGGHQQPLAVDLTQLPSGIYFVQLQNGLQQAFARLVKR